MNPIYEGFGDINLGVGRLSGIANLSDLFAILFDLAYGIGLSTSVIFVIVCGIKFATSTGDPGKKAEAQQCLIWSLVAAVVIVSFKLIPALVFNIFGIADPAVIMATT